MLLLAHTGITLGVAWFYQSLRNRRLVAKPAAAGRPAATALQPAVDCPSNSDPPPGNDAATRVRSLDFRLVLLGAILPDIIDKPLGLVLFPDFFHNTRIFAHTLIFLLSLLLLGISLYALQGKWWLLTLGFGSLMHLLLDQMWKYPAILFWPLHGWKFPPEDLTEWLSTVLHYLTHDVVVIAAEIVGGVILTVFLLKLLGRREVGHFLQSGLPPGTR